MSYTKTIVCLANSQKHGSGRCVAGREWLPEEGVGSWVRPVSARPTLEVSEEERQFEDGTDPNVLDIIAVPMVGPQPQHHQQENHLIDENFYWVKQGAVTWSQLQVAVEDPAGPLWLNGQSSFNGLNDQVPESHAVGLQRSLYLIRPEALTLTVGPEGGAFGPPRRRIRARFTVCGHSYCVVVTDPRVQRKLLAQSDGETVLEDALVCMSLGEVLRGYAYKLAAAIITPRRAGG